MTVPCTTLLPSESLEEKARRQLNRILASNSFRQVGRLQDFLTFVVEEVLAGRGDKLKEYPIGVGVFSKELSFNPRMDPLVRVQARRLRARLERYYREEGQNDEIVIEMPKGCYEPAFHSREVGTKRTVSAALISCNTILVQPFEDCSPSQDLGYFCSGLKHQVIHALSGTDTVRVAAWEQSKGVPAASHGQTNVAMIFGGSVRKSYDTLRITANLIDPSADCYLWSEVIDGDLDEPLRIQEEIASRLLERLRAEFAGEGGLRASGCSTANLAAHNLYVQGRYHLNQRTEQGLKKALDFFDRAVSEDAHHAPAYSGLADAHGLLAHYGVVAPAKICKKAKSNAEQAVFLDQESAEAHCSLAHVKATQDWDWAGAEREFQRAIALNPRYATAYHWYGMSCLVPLVRLDEALEQLRRAQALDPVSSIISRDTAVLYYYKRDFGGALEQCDLTIEQNPHFSAAYWTLGLVQDELGDFDEAIAAFRRAIQLSPPSPRIQGALGRTLARAGETREAHKILNDLKKQSKKRYVSPFELAAIYFAFNDFENGFKWLTRAFQDRCFELVAVKVDPKFDPVVRDPRFIELLRGFGLPVEQV